MKTDTTRKGRSRTLRQNSCVVFGRNAGFIRQGIQTHRPAAVPPSGTVFRRSVRLRTADSAKNHFARSFLRQLRLGRMADRLPIYEIERDIIARLKTDRRLILSAPTGSGKSTQVPQMLLKHGLLGNGQVVILQPRRLAARLLASRVAQELGVELGREVGYQIRFENCHVAADENPVCNGRRFAAAND